MSARKASSRGATTREIVTTFKEMYDADISPTLTSKVTEAVIDQVVEWQSRPLDPVYPIVYLDCIVVKIRQDKQVINKAIYLPWASISKATRNCWACGSPRTRAPSSD